MNRHKDLFYEVGPDGQYIGTVEVRLIDHVLWIKDVWVHPDHRKQGIGTRLMITAVGTYQDWDLYLQVDAFQNGMDDADLRKWYTSFGFLVMPSAPSIMRRPAGLFVGRVIKKEDAHATADG